MVDRDAYDDAALAASLMDTDKVEPDAVARAEALAAKANIRLDRALLRLGLVEEEIVLRRVAELLKLEFVETSDAIAVAPDAADAFGASYLRRAVVAPIFDEEGEMAFLTADPHDQERRAEIEFQLERPVRMMAATSATVLRAVDRIERGQAAEFSGPSAEQVEVDERALDEAQREGPIIRYVQRMLAEAVDEGASDLHVTSEAGALEVRVRLHGLLRRKHYGGGVDPSAVIARLKVMAGMNVAERRKPQDGRMNAVIGGRTIDFRVSALPTRAGESLVARVLDPMALRLGWEKLGFDAETTAAIIRIIEQPSGLFLVTGPTGSGKTTTLYTALAHLRSESRKIVTIEDPVEYRMDGVEQVQVHEAVGLTFATALRSVLRQDPNVLMVGEIRDSETAQIACRAAMVGRMVLSTLHTGSPEGAAARLRDLGVEDYIVNDVLKGVLGQELIATDGSRKVYSKFIA